MRLSLFMSLAVLLAAPFASLRAPATPASLPAPATVAQAEHASPKYRPGAVLVRFEPGMVKTGKSALANAGLQITHEIKPLGVVSVAVPVGQEEATVSRLSAEGDVAYAELDYQATALTVPGDPLYATQWGLAAISAERAWDATTGSSSVIIAIVDSGIDLVHPDLASKVWHNTGEIPYNGKDDDGNGYVDDANGWHFNAPGGDRFVSDDNGHGTHVAGIAAAATNNRAADGFVGVAGVSWGSPVMTVKVIDQFGHAWYSDVAAGIVYAADNGASIINLSVGGATPNETLCSAVSSVTARGKLVVAAAGNDGGPVFYPAACPGSLAVAATGRSDEHPAFSNIGSRVDLSAPGVDIRSTYYFAGLKESGYTYMDGTSEAAPFVSGAAALVWSRWPSLAAEGVKAQLLATVKDVGVPGKDDETGWGRLDAAAAVAAPAAAVDLRVGATVGPQTVVAGNPLTATFTIVNASANAATSLTLDATLAAEPAMDAIKSAPAVCRVNGKQMTCGVNRLEAGGTIVVSAVVTPTQVGAGELTTTAGVSAAQPELSPGDNAQTVKSVIRPALSGRVFLDSNGDGIRQAWETRGLADAYLVLEQGGAPSDMATSQRPGGAYQIDTVAPGNYLLRLEQLPDGFMLTTPQQVALAVQAGQEAVVDFGAWTGVAEPTPTPTPTMTPTVEPTPTIMSTQTITPTPPAGHRQTYLPLIVR